MKTKAILFDFDGVIADTEPQYDLYFNHLGEIHGFGKNFAARIKGKKLSNILEKYFENSPQLQKQIADEVLQLELNMDYQFIAGAREFIDFLSANAYKMAIVTSSPQEKMTVALEKMNLQNTFQSLVTASQITEGKPNPMCYLLAAKQLSVSPAECIVFEDSIAGIQAGLAAGAKVIALATTLPTETLKNYVKDIIPDFRNYTLP